jgi:hypothetical protein
MPSGSKKKREVQMEQGKNKRSYQFLAGQADRFAGPLCGGGAGSPPGVGQPEGGVVIHRHALHRQRPLILRQRLAQLMDRHLRI